MQSIIQEVPNIHPIFDDFDRLYRILSVKNEEKSLIPPQFSRIFKPLYDMFVEYGHVGKVDFIDKHYEILQAPKSNDNVIVCFSGGKDSTAVAKKFISEGKNVYLYYTEKINVALHDEKICAQNIADYFNVPLYLDSSLKLSGHHDYIEHPMKNMIIMNKAIQYGIKNNIGTHIATGNYRTSSLEDDNFEFCGGDDIEMWQIYDKIIGNVLQDFHVDIPLDSLDDTLEVVCGDRELLDLTVSCLGRASMRPYWNNWVKEKYGLTIPPYRCGRCYKCCVEYIYMTDKGLQEYNEEYYKYCFKNLRKNFQREDSLKYTNREVWEHYFSHSMEESQFFEGKKVRNYHMGRYTDV